MLNLPASNYDIPLKFCIDLQSNDIAKIVTNLWPDLTYVYFVHLIDVNYSVWGDYFLMRASVNSLLIWLLLVCFRCVWHQTVVNAKLVKI